jgi:hypothetical protein
MCGVASLGAAVFLATAGLALNSGLLEPPRVTGVPYFLASR